MLHRSSWRNWVLGLFVLLCVLLPASVHAARRFSFNANLADITRVCHDGIAFYFANDGRNPNHNGVGNWGRVTVRDGNGSFLGTQTLTLSLYPNASPGYFNVYALGQIEWGNNLPLMSLVTVTVYFFDTYLNADAELSDTFVVTNCSLTKTVPSNFTYQGQLMDSDSPANGQYDFRFRLYNAPSSGQQIGIDYSSNAVGVTNGQFAITPTFGPAVFDGNPRWLEIAVKPLNADPSTYATLTPRQQIMAVPYALQTLSVPQHQHLGEAWFGNWPLQIQGSFHSRDFTTVTPYHENTLSNFGLVISNVHDKGSGALIVSTGQSALFAYNRSAPSTDGLIRPAVYGFSENGEGGAFVTRNGSYILAGYLLTSAGYTRQFSFDWMGNLSSGGNLSTSAAYRSSGADFAEMLPALSGVEAGDVLVIGNDGKLTPTAEPNATTVAGVYSTQPGFLGGYAVPDELSVTASTHPTGGSVDANLSLEERQQLLIEQEVAANAGKIPLAITGVVPVKASAENGSILPGDLLTTSTLPGHAMKATTVDVGGIAIHRPGTIIGKALEGLTEGTGVIRVLITLQ